MHFEHWFRLSFCNLLPDMNPDSISRLIRNIWIKPKGFLYIEQTIDTQTGSSSVLAISRKVCYHAVPSGITNTIIIIIVTRPPSSSLSSSPPSSPAPPSSSPPTPTPTPPSSSPPPSPPPPLSPHHLQASWDGVEPLHGDLIGDRWWKPPSSFCYLSGENNHIC